MNANHKPQKPYWEMTTDELASATAEFDREFIIDRSKPLSPEMRARWERAKRKRGRAKRFKDMTDKELIALAGDTSEFDRPFIADTFGPPPPEMRARWERAKRKRGRSKRFKDMTDDELIALAGDTSIYDQEFVIDRAKPLSPEMRARWERAKRKRGRPRKGLGVRRIALTVEKGLLARADALAKRLGITRAELVARGLNVMLHRADNGAAGPPRPVPRRAPAAPRRRVGGSR